MTGVQNIRRDVLSGSCQFRASPAESRGFARARGQMCSAQDPREKWAGGVPGTQRYAASRHRFNRNGAGRAEETRNDSLRGPRLGGPSELPR